MHSSAEIAVVQSVSGGRLSLLFSVNEACAHCGVCRQSDRPNPMLEMDNTIGARPGDRVLVVLGYSKLRISIFLFGLPSSAFLVGLTAGLLWLHSEGAGLVLGIVVLAIYTLSARWFFRQTTPRLEKIDDREKTGRLNALDFEQEDGHGNCL
jgi:hypothetical protein